MSHFGQKKKAAPERPPERRFAAMWPKCQCRINRIPNRAAGTTGASGGGDRVSDGVLKLGQDALSTSHYHDSGSSIVRQVVPGRGRRERLAPCARNKTPLRSTAAWPARRARPAPRDTPAERRWRREAPPAYSTETRVTAGRASGLVDGRRRPTTALHAAETPPRAAAGCVATAAARLAAVDPASPLGAAYILDRDSGHGRESDGAGRRPPAT